MLYKSLNCHVVNDQMYNTKSNNGPYLQFEVSFLNSSIFYNGGPLAKCFFGPKGICSHASWSITLVQTVISKQLLDVI